MKTRINDFSKKVLACAIQFTLFAMIAVPGLAAAQSAADPKPADQTDQKPAGQKTASQKTANQKDEAEEEADDENGDVQALICPTNFFEVGIMGVSGSSPKFGEYNGLDRSGGYAVGNFNMSDGTGYCQRGGNVRWNAYGTDLGTTSRNFGTNVSAQGQWNIGVDFDQLRHYTTTGYETPFEGMLGDNLFTLPPGFGVINTTGTSTASGYSQVPLTATQLAAMHGENVYDERRNIRFNVGFNVNRDWNIKFNYNHLDMSGGKPISSATDVYDMSSLGGFSYGGERLAMLMNPTESRTDTFDLALNWTGKKAYVSADYYVSLYHDDYNGLSWSNPFVSGGTAGAPNPLTGASAGGAFPLDTMSTPPSNQFYQINLTGGYIFTPQTKLTGGLSFGLNTQNESYAGTYTIMPNTVPVLPVGSLDGRVLTKHADGKLTHQFSRALSLNVGIKYNERDNNTPVNTYQFLTLGGAATTVTNAPMSNKHEQFDVELAWRISQRQKLDFSYDYDHVDRWCGSALANNAQGSLSAANAAYYVLATCAQVPKSSDNSFNVKYNLNLLDSINFKAGYTYADRSATINPAFYNPMQSNSQGFENYGWMAWFQGSRRENLLKAGISWEVTPRFSIGLDGRYAQDNYYDSTLGVQDGKSTIGNLTLDYTPSANTSYGFYASWQDRSRYLLSSSTRNAMALPGSSGLWSNMLMDRDASVGLYGKQKLMDGRLQFTEDLSYDNGKSKYDTALLQNIAPAVGNSGATPDISSKLLQFRVTGTYQLSKSSGISAGWLYQHLKSNDYYYYAYQYGFVPTALIPSNQQMPSYSINVVYVLYRYSFQ